MAVEYSGATKIQGAILQGIMGLQIVVHLFIEGDEALIRFLMSLDNFSDGFRTLCPYDIPGAAGNNRLQCAQSLGKVITISPNGLDLL